ncbi:MAG TPA: GntR family transcriptional regulator [Ktedonobacteraceae bacterium]|nr:GntR family transcriptional regulator [Ktedonobacteraceae bacterium]
MEDPTRYRTVSKSSLIPMRYQIEQDMRERIETGIWKPGQQLPSEMELCSLYKVSRTTMRQAISQLVDEGLIVRERGRGSFIRDSMITAGARGLTSFSDEMAALGKRAGAQVLSIQKESASAQLAKRLRIKEEEPVVVIKRVRYANESPIGIQIASLPSARFPGLESADLTNQSLYAYLQQHYGVVVAEAEEIFTITPISGADARLLTIAEGTCGFYVERLTFDENKEPFEFVTSLMRGDRYRIQLFLRAPRRFS